MGRPRAPRQSEGPGLGLPQLPANLYLLLVRHDPKRRPRAVDKAEVARGAEDLRGASGGLRVSKLGRARRSRSLCVLLPFQAAARRSQHVRAYRVSRMFVPALFQVTIPFGRTVISLDFSLNHLMEGITSGTCRLTSRPANWRSDLWVI